MVYGYARVSSKEQCLDRQFRALRQYKEIDRVFADKQSGKDFAREQYRAMREVLQKGDEVVIEELDIPFDAGKVSDQWEDGGRVSHVGKPHWGKLQKIILTFSGS